MQFCLFCLFERSKNKITTVLSCVGNVFCYRYKETTSKNCELIFVSYNAKWGINFMLGGSCGMVMPDVRCD